MEPTQSTFHSIQLLRGLAALLVVLFHAHGAFSVAGSGAIFDQERYLFGFGAVGVHIFFVISGFIMVAASRFEPAFQPASFLMRRLIRIYPAYWVCAGLYVIYHTFVGVPYDLTWSGIGGALLLWPGNSASIIGPAWTLSFEMFFYLCFALTMWFGLTRGFLILAFAFCLFPLLGAIIQPESSFFRLATNSLMLEFIAGMAIGWLLRRKILPAGYGWLWIALSLLLFSGGAIYGYARGPSVLMWGVPSAFLVLGAVCLECRLGSSRMVRALGVLGGSSYSLYLLHILIITIALSLWRELPHPMDTRAITLAVIVSAACVGLAELFHRLIERPILRLLKPRRTPAPARQSAPTVQGVD